MAHNKIRELRKSAGLTQEQLSERLNIKRATLSRYENGTIDPPSSQIQAIAAVLGVTVGRLLGHESERVIIPGRLKLVEVNDPESGFIRYDIQAEDQEAFNYGLQILEGAGVPIRAHTPQALILAALDKLNEDGQQKAVERVEELTEIPRYRRQDGSVGVSPAPEGKDTTPPPVTPETAPEDE